MWLSAPHGILGAINDAGIVYATVDAVATVKEGVPVAPRKHRFDVWREFVIDVGRWLARAVDATHGGGMAAAARVEQASGIAAHSVAGSVACCADGHGDGSCVIIHLNPLSN